MQAHERLLTFEHISEFERMDDARKLRNAFEEAAAINENIAVVSVSFGMRNSVQIRWEYGWVKGGWLSDGMRFIERVCRRAGVEPLGANLRIAHEEQRPVLAA